MIPSSTERREENGQGNFSRGTLWVCEGHSQQRKQPGQEHGGGHIVQCSEIGRRIGGAGARVHGRALPSARNRDLQGV